MSKFQQYRNNPATAYYLNYLQIAEHEKDLSWIVDALFQSTLPIEWEFGTVADSTLNYYWRPPVATHQFIHPMDQYFKDLAQRLRTGASMFPPNSLQHRLCLNPPDVIKDILIMCGYLGIEPQSKMVWLAMCALSCDYNSDFYTLKESYILTGIPSSFYDPEAFENYQKIPVTFYVNKQTHEVFPYDPTFREFTLLIDTEPEADGWCVIPQLSKNEAARLVGEQVLVYDFSSLTSNIIMTQDLSKIKRMKVPNLAHYHLLRNEQDLFRDFLLQNRNISLAFQKTNELIFSGQIARTQHHHIDQPINQTEIIFDLNDFQPHTIEKPDEYIEKNFVVPPPVIELKRNQPYLDLNEFEPIVPKEIKVKVDKIINYREKIGDLEEPEVIFNLRCLRAKPVRYNKMYKLFRDQSKYGQMKEKCKNTQELVKIEKLIQTEKNITNYLLEFTAEYIQHFKQPSKHKKIEAIGINRPLNDDNILQQILEPPPYESRFYAQIQLTRKEARTIYDEVMHRPLGSTEHPVDRLVMNEYKRTSDDYIVLTLTCHISYPENESQQTSTSKSTTQNITHSDTDILSSKQALQTFQNTKQKVTRPPPILTESLINYTINEVDFIPIKSVDYKQTVCDFFVQKQIQIGRFKFEISKIDSLTKHWLCNSLIKLQKMTTKIEKELILAGQDAFVSNKVRVDFQTIESCLISLRQMGKVLISLFEKLSSIKPEVKLMKFE
ncbi:Conserved_hypothetical protein [Hexamita inflata]|uniref:Uncharacterized protein n=1 Tax=Hexamita inflata TaxID=28002 RepID=A0AA86R8F2_9EUKA|nr:Conserved hypothetical protein [Hexamita inflata]CAI9968238.1 Conserved hypothetical protein [Hexamita inflata]